MDHFFSFTSTIINGKGADFLIAIVNLVLIAERSKLHRTYNNLISTLADQLAKAEKEKEELKVQHQAVLMRMDKHKTPLA